MLADRFALERQIGGGGMGTVFRAVDRVTGAPVAVKSVDATEEAQRRDQIVELLREKGSVSAAARSLGKARSQVQRWIGLYGIDARKVMPTR